MAEEAAVASTPPQSSAPPLGSTVIPLYRHKKKVHSVAWNYTGTKRASGSVDQTARVWHIEPHGHGKAKDIELKGHTDSVDQLCWDPKHADLIATASGDKTVRLWDARRQSNNWTMDSSGSAVGRKENGTVPPLDKTGGDESCIIVNEAELHCHPHRQGSAKQRAVSRSHI
ncbi:hypothetical protein ES319_A03G093800v1 [Gossypium barbadense]|uniref:Uncharacterized protein n=1 Tax=Gossypium barbadense TaxID=3634 RepID=A0A2P5YXQ3_GOSBA|nr:hypothetical protein ES319_A03G093800v1 [Gossypium barbadense]PPS20388.1 hypothetical protein GOBAR_AA00167 [Gossypium barbadense]